MNQEIESKVNTILSSLLSRTANELTASSSLKDDLDVDSTELVEICSALEKTFNLSIEDGAEKKLKTVGDIYALVVGVS